MVGAGAVVAEAHRRPRPQENRTGIAHPRGHRHRFHRVNLQVLGRVGVYHLDARVDVVDKHDPGLRAGQRSGDAALIKDNHVVAAGSVVAALRAVRAVAPDIECEVEVDSLEQLDEVMAEGAELVLLDNFPVWQAQVAVQRRDARAPQLKLEASGGLSLETAAAYAKTGVDYLAVGALTHSARVLDIGLDM
ncbi:Probable nicotinate-nucleotide pyrophosphatase NadC [Mycobacteroides abscessus]|nr:Probable nicotinate-nucleotide pyrophosphatase NadC [Mycobacteroides abscessus]